MCPHIDNITWLNEAPNTTVPTEKGINGGERGLKDRRAGYSSTPATTRLTELHHLAKILGI